MFLYGVIYGGYLVVCMVVFVNFVIMECEGVFVNVCDNEVVFCWMFDGLFELLCVGDVCGDGYYYLFEFVIDKVVCCWVVGISV